MKNERFMTDYLANYTKSEISTMETFPNCTKLHLKNRIKNEENLLQGLFLCGILEQNRIKSCSDLHNSTIYLQIYKICFTNAYTLQTGGKLP